MLFYVIINFYKNYFIIIILLYFFSWKLFLFFHVPGCSGMFRVPGFIDAPYWRVGKQVRNDSICTGIEDFPFNGCSEKNLNCKLKLHSEGFLYYQILEAVTVLKFLQTLALDFPYICRQLEMQ